MFCFLTCPGKQLVMAIEADVTFIRERKLVKPTKGFDGDYFEIDLELEFLVHGRDLLWKAKWKNQIVAQGNFSVAAALQPGTE